MAGAFGIAGWYLGSSPTTVTSESNIRIGESAMPWNTKDDDDHEGKEFYKYRYHPHGDKSKELKEAPSALNEVVIPNVTLPKVCPFYFDCSQLCFTMPDFRAYTCHFYFLGFA